jgi:hypothetical protein
MASFLARGKFETHDNRAAQESGSNQHVHIASPLLSTFETRDQCWRSRPEGVTRGLCFGRFRFGPVTGTRSFSAVSGCLLALALCTSRPVFKLR